MLHSATKKILIYAPDGVGYGHIDRMANLAHLIKKHISNTNILFVSGYYCINNFLEEDIGLDYIKLPYYNKVKLDTNANTSLLKEQSKILRKEIINSIFKAHKYDYIIVDFFPFGTKGELFSHLKRIKKNNPDTTIILTQRGVAFSKEKTLEFFKYNSGIDYINKVYDKIICFCDNKIIDLNNEYFNHDIKIPIKYLGYLHSNRIIRNNKNTKKSPNILVDFGGGYKCDYILIALLKELSKKVNLNVTVKVLLGEYLTEDSKKYIKRTFPKNPQLQIFDVVPKKKIPEFGTNMIIGCGGYNTTIDAIFTNLPIIVIPKDHTEEAFIHVSRLTQYSNIKILPITHLKNLWKTIQIAVEEIPNHSLANFGRKELYKMLEHKL